MSAARSRSYRPPRARSEVVWAVVGSLAVLALTALLLWVLAPDDESTSVPVKDVTPATSAPVDVPTTVPSATLPATTVPGE
jgi:hypothetical protein